MLRWLHIAFFSIALWSPATARAHIFPEVYGVAAYDAQGVPVAIEASHGLMLREGEAWRYVCPVAHGGPDTPRTVAPRADRMWVSTVAGLRLYDGSLQPLTPAFPDVLYADVPVLATGSAGTFVVAQREEDTALYALSPSGVTYLARFEGPWRTIAVADAIWIARTTSTGIDLVELERDGRVTTTATVAFEARDVALHTAAGRVFAAASDGLVSRVWEVSSGGFELLVQYEGSIVGDVTVVDGAVYVALDRFLHRLEGGRAIPTDPIEPVSCLANGPTGPYLCSNLALYAVTPEGVIGAPVFLLDQVEPPDTSALSLADAATCEAQWADFERESGLDPLTRPVDPPPDPGGCRCVGTRRGGLWLFAFVLLSSFAVPRCRSARTTATSPRSL